MLFFGLTGYCYSMPWTAVKFLVRTYFAADRNLSHKLAFYRTTLRVNIFLYDEGVKRRRNSKNEGKKLNGKKGKCSNIFRPSILALEALSPFYSDGFADKKHLI